MSLLLTDNPIALQQLFTETLFCPATERVPEAGAVRPEAQERKPVSPVIPHQGGNARQILFLLKNAELDYFSAAAQEAFNKTLAALGLALPDIVLINLGRCAIALAEIYAAFTPRYVIALGKDVPLEAEPFNEFIEHQGRHMLRTYSFEQMLSDLEGKRAFWRSIQLLKID